MIDKLIFDNLLSPVSDVPMCMGVESSTGTNIFTRIAMKKPIFTLKATAKGWEEDADNFPTNMSLKGKNYSIFFNLFQNKTDPI